MSDKIKTLFIYEIVGRPAEHIKISLEQLIDRIGENPGIKIISRKVHEPNIIQEENLEKELFSTFAEVEMEIDDLELVFRIVLNTLPSNVEILDPKELRLKNFDLSSVLAELAIKLHKFDEVTKVLALEKSQLINFMKEMDKKIIELGGESVVKFEKDREEKNNS